MPDDDTPITVKIFDGEEEKGTAEVPADEYLVICGANKKLGQVSKAQDGTITVEILDKD